MEILAYIQSNWVTWVFGAITAALAWGYKSISTRLKEEQQKNKAIADGVQSLLRESIVENYNRYSDKGYCPIYAKESIKRVYQAYTALDGNDVAHELYQKILRMPEERTDTE